MAGTYPLFIELRRLVARPAAAMLLVAAVFALAACGSDNTAAPGGGQATTTSVPTASGSLPAFPLTLNDSSGTSVTVAAQPQRIVSHSPAITEILFAIGAGPQVVAVDQFSNYPPEAVDLQLVRYSDPDPEQAVVLEPDLIFFSNRQSASVDAFRALDLPVFFANEADSIDGVLSQIVLIGRLTGHAPAAEALVLDMRTRIDAIAAGVADVTEGPTVFYELTDSLFTVAPDSFIGGMLTLLKARNVAEGSTTAFPQLTAEVVVERNPDVILLAEPPEAGVTLESVAARPGWSQIAAVENGRVIAVDADISSRPGPRIVEGLEIIAKALYPDRFE